MRPRHYRQLAPGAACSHAATSSNCKVDEGIRVYVTFEIVCIRNCRLVPIVFMHGTQTRWLAVDRQTIGFPAPLPCTRLSMHAAAEQPHARTLDSCYDATIICAHTRCLPSRMPVSPYLATYVRTHVRSCVAYIYSLYANNTYLRLNGNSGTCTSVCAWLFHARTCCVRWFAASALLGVHTFVAWLESYACHALCAI